MRRVAPIGSMARASAFWWGNLSVQGVGVVRREWPWPLTACDFLSLLEVKMTGLVSSSDCMSSWNSLALSLRHSQDPVSSGCYSLNAQFWEVFFLHVLAMELSFGHFKKLLQNNLMPCYNFGAAPRLKIQITGLIIPIWRSACVGTTIQKSLKPQPCLRRQAKWCSFSHKRKSQKSGLFFEGKSLQNSNPCESQSSRRHCPQPQAAQV